MKHLTTAPAAVMAVALGVVIGYQAVGQRAVQPDAPVVAAVRLDKLFENLRQRADAKVELAAMEQKIREEKRSREEKIKSIQAQLEALVAPAARAQLSDQISLEQFRLKYWFQEAVGELEVERALRLQDLYKAIRSAIAALAAAGGYDIVILNDSSDELPYDRDPRGLPPQVQVLQQIMSRHILYINEAIDITQDLTVRMNNQYRAGP